MAVKKIIAGHDIVLTERDWMTTQETYEYLACGRKLLDRLVALGQVRMSRIGKIKYYSKRSIDSMFERNIANKEACKIAGTM